MGPPVLQTTEHCAGSAAENRPGAVTSYQFSVPRRILRLDEGQKALNFAETKAHPARVFFFSSVVEVVDHLVELFDGRT